MNKILTAYTDFNANEPLRAIAAWHKEPKIPSKVETKLITCDKHLGQNYFDSTCVNTTLAALASACHMSTLVMVAFSRQMR